MQAFDGVTTTLELEAGVLPVALWYENQARKGRVLNYGTAANWVFARIAAMIGAEPEADLAFMGRNSNDKRWIENVASDAEVKEILTRCARAWTRAPSASASSTPMRRARA